MKNIRYTIWFLAIVIVALVYCNEIKSEENKRLTHHHLEAVKIP